MLRKFCTLKIKIDQASLVTLAVIIILGLFVFKNSTILDQNDCIPELKIYECYFYDIIITNNNFTNRYMMYALSVIYCTIL